MICNFCSESCDSSCTAFFYIGKAVICSKCFCGKEGHVFCDTCNQEHFIGGVVEGKPSTCRLKNDINAFVKTVKRPELVLDQSSLNFSSIN